VESLNRRSLEAKGEVSDEFVYRCRPSPTSSKKYGMFHLSASEAPIIADAASFCARQTKETILKRRITKLYGYAVAIVFGLEPVPFRFCVHQCAGDCCN